MRAVKRGPANQKHKPRSSRAVELIGLVLVGIIYMAAPAWAYDATGIQSVPALRAPIFPGTVPTASATGAVTAPLAPLPQYAVSVPPTAPHPVSALSASNISPNAVTSETQYVGSSDLVPTVETPPPAPKPTLASIEPMHATPVEASVPASGGWFGGSAHTADVQSMAQTSVPQPMLASDGGSIKPEMARAWAEDLQALELENQILRKKLSLSENDPLRDIRVDSVTQIREDVLRARVVELEKELDKLHMKDNSGDLPQKSTSMPTAATSVPKIP